MLAAVAVGEERTDLFVNLLSVLFAPAVERGEPRWILQMYVTVQFVENLLVEGTVCEQLFDTTRVEFGVVLAEEVVE